ncbi:MAG TPA: type II toxin-antitoxin system VapC family toxin [Thermoanaerobaculia bacterium]|nr:type II toxin-antitoxin system VapC family toxin [Thermoanaerobaculia bacterium]
MKPKVYLETSVVSYLTASPSRDVVLLAHQQMTREWWDQRGRYDLYVSPAVLTEVARGNTDAAADRLAALEGLAVLALTSAASQLAERLVRFGAMPSKAIVDAVHIAVAAVHGMDYLLTWNLAHIANARIRGTVEAACREFGLQPPVICTPEELIEE